MADPLGLWASVGAHAAPDAMVLVMDLLRPASAERAVALVEAYAAQEPEILRRDFHRSLLAAYRPEEIRGQLAAAALSGLTVEVVSDRHVAVYGRLEERAGTQSQSSGP